MNIRPYTKGTANRESADMLMKEMRKVERGRRGRAQGHVIGHPCTHELRFLIFAHRSI